jgi:hypothetical protein
LSTVKCPSMGSSASRSCGFKGIVNLFCMLKAKFGAVEIVISKFLGTVLTEVLNNKHTTISGQF